MKTNLNRKILPSFLLLTCLLIFGVAGYVRSDGISNISCSAVGTNGYASCGSTGSGSKNVTWPAIPSTGPDRVETTITLSGLNPYMQPYYIRLEVGGHTNCWYGYANDYPPTSGWPSCNTDQSNHNSGGDLNWMMCLNGNPGISSTLCWSGSQNYPSNSPGQNISLDEEGNISNTTYTNYVGLMANVVYDNNSQELGDTDYVNLSSSYRLVSIDSFIAPASADVGVPFSVGWTTDWSTVPNYPKLIISGPITCNQTGYIPNQTGTFPIKNGSTQCTGTSPGTATLTLQASGPSVSNTNAAKVVEQIRQVEIGGTPTPPPSPSPGSCALTPTPAIGVFPMNNVDMSVDIGGGNSAGSEINIDCTNDGSYDVQAQYVNWSPVVFPDVCSYSGPATARAHTRDFATQAEADCTAPISAPTISNSVSISSALVKPDSSTPYSITVASNDTSGGTNISHLYALINGGGIDPYNRGTNTGQYRGLLLWYYGGNPWPGYKDNMSCTGGGYAAVDNAYGDQYIHLLSCSSTISGNLRTVVFNVEFEIVFTTPVSNNDISGNAQDTVNNISTGWVNHDLNFGLDLPLVGGVCSGGIDVGLRIYEGGVVRKVAAESGAPTSFLRVYRNGIYGVVLVNPTDANASKMRIQTYGGVKALCLLP